MTDVRRIKATLSKLRGNGSIVVSKKLMVKIGVLEAVVYAELLSKYLYYAERGLLDSQGMFFCTISDLYEATGLSSKVQSRIIDRLVDLNLIQKVNKGLLNKRYFLINLDVD